MDTVMLNIPCQYQLPGAPMNKRSPSWNGYQKKQKLAREAREFVTKSITKANSTTINAKVVSSPHKVCRCQPLQLSNSSQTKTASTIYWVSKSILCSSRWSTHECLRKFTNFRSCSSPVSKKATKTIGIEWKSAQADFQVHLNVPLSNKFRGLGSFFALPWLEAAGNKYINRVCHWLHPRDCAAYLGWYKRLSSSDTLAWSKLPMLISK